MEFRDNPRLSRYELLDGDTVVAVAEYIERPYEIEIPHTEVLPELRGGGIGAELVKQALDAVRATGKQVVPRCWFVADFIAANPSYADLVAA
jgi:predicted GNAT family acetyltransferase